MEMSRSVARSFKRRCTSGSKSRFSRTGLGGRWPVWDCTMAAPLTNSSVVVGMAAFPALPAGLILNLLNSITQLKELIGKQLDLCPGGGVVEFDHTLSAQERIPVHLSIADDRIREFQLVEFGQ